MRFIAIGALLLAIVCGGVAVYLSWRNDALQDQVAAANRRLSVQARQLENAHQDKAVLKAHIDRMQADQRGLETQLQNLRGKEGYDAPLSDLLGDVFDGL
ncbi:hypothetical protein [Phaeobacter sp. JH209A]|uniref:hypothetical protein n=1 Tax=Phaeobacter sp. JH209A TaxID=3112505 RepID=UPI003A8C318B